MDRWFPVTLLFVPLCKMRFSYHRLFTSILAWLLSASLLTNKARPRRTAIISITEVSGQNRPVRQPSNIQYYHLLTRICKLLFVPFFKMRLSWRLSQNQVHDRCCPHLSLPRRCVPYPIGTKKVEDENCWQRLYSRCLITHRHSASLPSETEASSSVCGKNRFICCRHLIDEFDPKHHALVSVYIQSVM